MKNKIKSALITFILLLMAVILLVFVYFIFISGPVIEHDLKIEKNINSIEKNNNVENVYRDLFAYDVYIGENKNSFVFYDKDLIEFYKIKKSRIDLDKVSSVALTHNFSKDCEISIGFGYDYPVYKISENDRVLLLDFNDLSIVYGRDK